jgi:protein-S-isoprenylcysteine O-methyltransferase Ste14
VTQLEWASLGVFLVYLVWFFGMTTLATHQAGRKMWLLDRAEGFELVAVWGFRLAFGLAVGWGAVAAVAPGLVASDPLASWRSSSLPDVPGHLVVVAGAMIAAASQVYMGASWRVGTVDGEAGTLVDGGPFAISRNPVFLGHALMFLGLFAVLPAMATAIAAIVYAVCAEFQIRREEQVLTAHHGASYEAYLARVPRWIGGYSRRKETSSAGADK